jgi:mycoredoxin
VINENLTIYGVVWCGDCRRAQRFLRQHQIAFDFINIDHDKAAEQFVVKTNKGFRSVPTIVFPDGSILVEPSNKQLAIKLQIQDS